MCVKEPKRPVCVKAQWTTKPAKRRRFGTEGVTRLAAGLLAEGRDIRCPNPGPQELAEVFLARPSRAEAAASERSKADLSECCPVPP
jgi:hypothetical protein